MPDIRLMPLMKFFFAFRDIHYFFFFSAISSPFIFHFASIFRRIFIFDCHFDYFFLRDISSTLIPLLLLLFGRFYFILLH